MKRLSCPVCAARVYFENVACGACGASLLFVAPASAMARLQDGIPCQHRAIISCNWATEPGQPFCQACRLNRTIPNLSEPGNAARWERIERAKRRLVADLLRLGLPIVSRRDDPQRGLCFDFVSNALGAKPVMTGHMNGLITLDIAEADAAEREARRAAMREPYRTLIGHFRHEIAHFYFALLVEPGPLVASFRAVFGDERRDYAQALRRHYSNGPPPQWPEHFISAYASCHPWEDWAETFAHFIHIVATLDTAVETAIASGAAFADVYREPDFDRVLASFPPLTDAVNEINRSMGMPDVYPFRLTPSVIGKLHFVHMVVRWATRDATVDALTL